MKGIEIKFTEEFEERIEAIFQKTLENYVPPQNEVVYKTRKEAADKLRISLPTLNAITKKGIINAYRLNGRVLYRDDELDAALQSVNPIKYRRK